MYISILDKTTFKVSTLFALYLNISSFSEFHPGLSRYITYHVVSMVPTQLFNGRHVRLSKAGAL